MHPVIAALARHAAARPGHVALSDGVRDISYGAAYQAVNNAAAAMNCERPATVGLALDNGPAWLLIDLATLAARMRCVPVPGFFSATQQLHLLRDAAVELLITDRPEFHAELLRAHGIAARGPQELHIGQAKIYQFLLMGSSKTSFHPHTVKITYTSGTTGTPKGVCLDGGAVAAVAMSLAGACRLTYTDRHLSLLPLATLLENVAAYSILIAGGTCIVPPLEFVGMQGSSRFDCERMLHALQESRASTAIAAPHMIQAAVAKLESDRTPLKALRFLAMGGAPAPASLLERAAAVRLPLYQGYGLSECASVVTLNTPAYGRRTSVGRPLPHARVVIADDGEVCVSGATLLGYCGSDAAIPDPWPTADTGYFDDDGYLHLTGRKKDIFITAYGRNVAPEWVEAELTTAPCITQAWVYGEGRPSNVAVITAAPGHGPHDIDAAIARANARLPDYARIAAWVSSEGPFSYARGELTVNGKLRRDVLLSTYRSRIDRLYEECAANVL
jgi:long-chain acyl-CoA synthetase